MIKQLQKQDNAILKIRSYLINHKVSLGIFLASYGTFYLATVIMSGWNITSINQDANSYVLPSITALLSQNSIALIFFVTSLISILLGAILLCFYSLYGLSLETVEHREGIGIILTTFGFFYIIVGAWPMRNIVEYSWEWQKQIASNGPAFSWLLYALATIVFLIGCLTVYKCSKIYHKKHPEFGLEP